MNQYSYATLVLGEELKRDKPRHEIIELCSELMAILSSDNRFQFQMDLEKNVSAYYD